MIMLLAKPKTILITLLITFASISLLLFLSPSVVLTDDTASESTAAFVQKGDAMTSSREGKTLIDDPVYDALYVPLSAAVIALLGVAITIYVFLCDGLRGLKQNKPHIVKIVDKVKSDCSKFLIIFVFIGLFSFVVGVALSNGLNASLRIPCNGWRIIYIVSSFLSIGALVWFGASLIDYDVHIAYRAKRMLTKSIENKSLSEDTTEFIKVMGDLRIICGLIVEQSSRLVGNLPEKNRIASALMHRVNNSVDIIDVENIANKYQDLSDAFDYVITAIEYPYGKGPISVPLNDARELEKAITRNYMSNGLFEDIVLSGKTYSESDFHSTSFKKSLFSNVKFINATMENASFQNCRLQGVELSVNANSINSADFASAVFIKFTHEKPIKFVNSVFIDADFTEQRKIECIHFERSALANINFSNCQLERVSFFRCAAPRANLTHSIIKDVGFSKANFSEAVLESAAISYSICSDEIDYSNDDGTTPTMLGANFSGANMFRVVICHANLGHSRLERTNFSDASLTDCAITESYCNDVSFTHSRLKNIDFTHSLLNRADFSHADVYGKTLFKSSLCNYTLFIKTRITGTLETSVSFKNTQLRNAQFISGEYKYCDFSGAIFDGSMLSAQTRFIECDFTEASFIDADVYSEFVNCKNMPVGRCSIANTGHDSSCYDVILRRKSTRSFSDQIIPSHIIERILEAARWAPSAKNRQPWNYKIILSPDEIKKISDRLSEKGDSIQETAKSIRSARALILVGRDKNAKSEDRMPDLLSIGASVENMLLAATEAGLDNLWVCDILDARDEIQIELDFKAELVSAVCLGYKDNYSDGRTRKSLNEIIDYGNKQ